MNACLVLDQMAFLGKQWMTVRFLRLKLATRPLIAD